MICFVITSHYDLSKENRHSRDIEEIVLLLFNCPVSFATKCIVWSLLFGQFFLKLKFGLL